VLASFLQLLCLVVGFAFAGPPEDPFRVEVTDVTVAPNGTTAARVTVVVPKGFHVYRDMMDVTVTDAGGLTIGPASFPPGMMTDDPASPGTNREQFDEDVLIDLPVTAPATAGKYTAALSVRYQGCKKNLCYFPAEQTPSLVVTVAGEPVAPGTTGAATPAPAGDPAGEQDVILTGKAGTPNTVTIGLDLQGDWHVNKAFVSLTLVDAAGFTLGEPMLPAGEKSGDAAAGTEREDYTHDLDLVAPISGPPGAATVKVEVGFQACKGVSLCKMPEVRIVDVPVVLDPTYVAGAATPAAPSATLGASTGSAGTGLSKGFAVALYQGVWTLAFLCFVAGVGVSFTPCVLPMVPITMALIGAKGAGSRFAAFGLSATYVLGQALVYTSLGVSAGMTGALFGSWLQEPLLLAGVAVFFVVMGLGMFGAFDIGVPSFIASRLSGKGGGGGFSGAFLLGMIGAVLAGPCSGPVVASVLALISQGGNLALGAGLMFSFSLGMGMIILVAGGATGWLPKRGMWMVAVKQSFGIFLWLGAIYFALPLIPFPYGVFLTALVFLVTAVFAWPSEEDGESFALRRLRQSYSFIGGLAGAYLLLAFTLVQAGFLHEGGVVASGSAASSEGGARPGIQWVRTEAEALELARSSGKPVMIDFTADWCAACHEMEKFTYTDPRVIAESGKFVTAMLDCTKKGDAVMDAVQKKYGVSGLPTVVFVMPDGRRLGGTVGFVEAEDFLKEMQAALEAKG
jgi:thiol:disulfide interchange protein DsbD